MEKLVENVVNHIIGLPKGSEFTISECIYKLDMKTAKTLSEVSRQKIYDKVMEILKKKKVKVSVKKELQGQKVGLLQNIPMIKG